VDSHERLKREQGEGRLHREQREGQFHGSMLSEAAAPTENKPTNTQLQRLSQAHVASQPRQRKHPTKWRVIPIGEGEKDSRAEVGRGGIAEGETVARKVVRRPVEERESRITASRVRRIGWRRRRGRLDLRRQLDRRYF